MKSNRALIFANGLLPDMEAARNLVQTGDAIYAADGGTKHILRLGLLPDLVVGDLDSLEKEDLEFLQFAGIRIERFPRDKEKTDLELTINYALENGHHNLVIVAALGGRLDMTLSSINLLTRPDLMEKDIKLDDGVEAAYFVQQETIIFGNEGDVISLLPWGGKVSQVTTSGLRWELHGEDLNPYETRPISNEMQTKEARIQVGSGNLLCIHRRKNHFSFKSQADLII